MRRLRRILPVFAATALLIQGAGAGMLDDFEEAAGKPKDKKKKPDSYRGDQYDSFGSGTYPSSSGGESFMESFWFWLVSSPFAYRYDDPSASMLSESGDDEWAGEGSRWRSLHPLGSPVLPYVRADYNWQYIDSDLDAQDVRLELGYKLLAFHGRHTRYTESNPSDALNINQFYGVFRVGGGGLDGSLPILGWELGLGAGVVQQDGDEEHSSGAFTVPLKIYPTEWLGLEFRPAWYKPQERAIGDYDLSASLGWRYVQLRTGYRWLWVQGQGHFLNGPYAGVSVTF